MTDISDNFLFSELLQQFQISDLQKKIQLWGDHFMSFLRSRLNVVSLDFGSQ